MKELIIKALADSIAKLDKQRPTTKKKVKSVYIDVEPKGLPQFMENNNVPDDCWFDVQDDSAPFSSQELFLSWTIDVPTTEKDDMAFNRKRFTSISWNLIRPVLLENGYERTGFNSGLLKDFDDTTVYDMYIAEDFDRLVKYYSLPFIKK